MATPLTVYTYMQYMHTIYICSSDPVDLLRSRKSIHQLCVYRLFLTMNPDMHAALPILDFQNQKFCT